MNLYTSLQVLTGETLANTRTGIAQPFIAEAAGSGSDGSNRIADAFGDRVDSLVPDSLAESLDRPYMVGIAVGLGSLATVNYGVRSFKLRKQRKALELGNDDNPDNARRQSSGSAGEIEARKRIIANDRAGYRRGAVGLLGLGLGLAAFSDPVTVSEVRNTSEMTMVVAVGEGSLAEDISVENGPNMNRFEGPVQGLIDFLAESDGLEATVIAAGSNRLSSSSSTDGILTIPQVSKSDLIGDPRLPEAIEAAAVADQPTIVVGYDMSGLEMRRVLRDTYDRLGEDLTVIAVGQDGSPISVLGEPKIAEYNPAIDNPIEGLDINTASSKEEIVSYIEQFDESYTDEVRERAILKDILLISSGALLFSAIALDRFSDFRKKRQANPGRIMRGLSKVGSKFKRSDKSEGEI